MAPIQWNEDLATGLDELDGQHRTLVDTFNRLVAVVAGHGSRDEQEGLMIFLRDFAVRHFETEQELMVRSGYPEETEHRRLHAELAMEVDDLLDRFHRGEAALTPVILEDLDGWLRRHIREEDFRLAEFLMGARPGRKGRL